EAGGRSVARGGVDAEPPIYPTPNTADHPKKTPRNNQFVADVSTLQERPKTRHQHPDLGEPHPASGGFGMTHPAQAENEACRGQEVAEFGEKGPHNENP